MGAVQPGACVTIAYKWVQSSAYASIPANAIVGGNDEDGAMIYVGRAEHMGDMLVCKVVPSKQLGFISYRGEALPKDVFEVLCGQNLIWIKCYDHVIPETAVLCGRSQLDQPVYIGRGHYDGHLIIGKISSVHRALFIAYRGAERRLDSYEILVEEKRVVAGWQLPPPPEPLEPEVSLEMVKNETPVTPPIVATAAKPMLGLKPYPYPPDLESAPAFSLDDRPPSYTPMPMPTTAPYPMPMVIQDPSPMPPIKIEPYPMPMASTDPYPPRALGILPESKAPLTFGAPYLPQRPPPPSYTPAQTATGSRSFTFVPAETASGGSSYTAVPAETYIPPMAAASSGYTTAVCLPAFGMSGTHDVWLSAGAGYTPPDAVFAGHDSDNAPLLVCRAYHAGMHIPGKAAPSRGCAYIVHAGRELVEANYEVLVGQDKYHWVPGCDGSIAAGAVFAGRDHNGEYLYVARANYCGSLTPGKLQQSRRAVHIPYGGQEVRISSYEILVRSDVYYRQQNISLSY